jgi:hypothetical protein
VWLALLELRPFLGPGEIRRGGAKDLTIVPYLTGGILYTVAGMLNPVGVILVGLSAAAASFGGTSGLAWMTHAFQLYATGGSSVPEPSSAVRVGICRSFNNLAIALMLSPCCVYASNIVRTISDSVSFTS